LEKPHGAFDTGDSVFATDRFLLMTPYQVGQLYVTHRTRWPQAAEYNYRAGNHELLLFIPDVTEREVEDVRHGPADFGLLVDGDIIFFLYRFRESIPWSEATSSWRLVRENHKIIPNPDTNSARALLLVVLIDASTGVVRVSRSVWLSREFTRSLHKALRDRAARPWRGVDSYELQLHAAYRKYRNAALMVELAVLAKGQD
jgi:hypothetical protein